MNNIAPVPKICRDCTHYKFCAEPLVGDPAHQCLWEKESPDLVTGHIKPIVRNCYDERSASGTGKCKAAGFNFVQRKSFSTID